MAVDIKGASTQKNFKGVEIVDDSNPYLSFLGIDWATYMNGVINLKRQKMIFEKNSLPIVVPLNPSEGARYSESMRNEDNDDELDYIYQIAMQYHDRVNLTVDR